MKNFVKSAAVGVGFAFMPLNVNADTFVNSQKRKEVKSELFENLNNSKIGDTTLNGNMETRNFVSINPKLVVDATLDYFKEDVKAYKLSPEAKERLVGALNSYLLDHLFLEMGDSGEIVLIIDDKIAFSQLVKQFVNIVIDDMPFFVRKIAIPLFFGGMDGIQKSLDNLDSTVMNMKEKQYKDVIFDYIGGIVKRVVISLGGNMKVGDYYGDMSSYYPNKNSGKIMRELEESGLSELDIKNLKYPFKK